MGRLTAGKAAQLAGMSRLPFLARLATFGVAAINIQGEEIDEEIAAARELVL
jgi:predicted HTH domain antitoxin